MPDFDTSELSGVAADFTAAAVKVALAVVPVAHRAGGNMARTMRKDAAGHRHLPGLASTVGYDLEARPLSVTVDVGFRKSGQGNLANIAAFGSVNNAPVMDITRALRDEVPNFMRWVAKVGSEAL